MLTEAQGCEVLRDVFTSRGFAIVENVPFAEGDVRFNIDGWDARARAGYEYLSRHDGDFEELPPSSLRELERRMGNGELYVLLIEQSEVTSLDTLARAAHAFLDEVARRRKEPG